VWVYYQDGKRIRQDEDQDCDGVADVRYFFENGSVVRREGK
jgi:hypothetical protein